MDDFVSPPLRTDGDDGLDQSEVPLRESEERFKLLVESVKDYAIFLLDPDGVITSWNAGAERIKGYAAHEAIGRHFSMFYAQDNLDRGWPEYELRVARKEGRFEDEGWRVRKDGTRFWANVVITALYTPNGDLYGFAKVTRDLTDRKRIEALELAERRMTEFLAMLSHELRNPLAPIRNAVSVMRSRPIEDPKLVWSHEVIDRQVTHLTGLIDDLLDVSRVATGGIKLVKEPTEIAAVIARAVEAAQPFVEENKHRLQVVLPDEQVLVNGDPTRLMQVVLNLLHNAARYTPEGGEIRVSVVPEGEHVALRVRDTGIGIPAELRSKVFDLFVQGERTPDRTDGGLGIGLTLVRMLVEMHDGTVSITSSDVGQGTEFLISLPMLPAPKPVAEVAEGEESSVAARALRVLVVEDNPDVADSMEMILDIWGHDARIVADGPAALDTVPAFRPDIVLLDIGLPGMDGYEVVQRLRELPEIEGTTLVALTGYGQESDRQRALAAGFDHHMVKPVDPDVLETFLATCARPGS